MVKELQGFTVEIDGQAILAISASSMDRARALCTQNWLADELRPYRSNGLSIWSNGATLSIRPANPIEMAELEVAKATEIREGECESIVFAFLIPLDPPLH